MRNPARFVLIVVLLYYLVTIVDSCKKNDAPTLTTAEVTNITGTTATSGGTITDEGSGAVVEKGICWSKKTNPTTADDRTTEGGGAGTFVSNMSGLAASTNYYIRAYCFYNNDIINNNVYGALYNWYTITDPRRICPTDWHVPSDAEWNILTDFLGGSNIAGMKIKEVGLEHWVSPNSGASNLSGFTALPGGSRYSSINDDFLGMGYYGIWWSSTEDNSNKESAWFRSLSTFNPPSRKASADAKARFNSSVLAPSFESRACSGVHTI